MSWNWKVHIHKIPEYYFPILYHVFYLSLLDKILIVLFAAPHSSAEKLWVKGEPVKNEYQRVVIVSPREGAGAEESTKGGLHNVIETRWII